MNRPEALAIIYRALENLNEELESPIPLREDVQLFGADSLIDSLSLVSVIVDVESDVSGELGILVSLTDDRAISQEVSPFTSPAALADYVVMLSQEQA